MCDLCGRNNPGEIELRYALFKSHNMDTQFFQSYETHEIARVHASVCNSCYEKKTGDTEDLSVGKGIFRRIRNWNRRTNRAVRKAELVESVAIGKLQKIYPDQVKKAVSKVKLSPLEDRVLDDSPGFFKYLGEYVEYSIKII